MLSSAAPEPSVTYVVPTYDRPDALARTLDHLARVDYPPDRLEVVVVDDGSPAPAQAAAKRAVQRLPNARYVPQENAGVATARNRGAKLAQGEVVIFLDDDILVESSNVRAHLARHDDSGRSLVSAATVELVPELIATLEQTPFGRFLLDFQRRSEALAVAPGNGGVWESDVAAAANFSIARATFLDLGGFDEAFPFAGAEDRDFTGRAHRAGSRIVHDPAIRVLHNDSHVDLHRFLRRQERNAVTWVFFAARNPAGAPEPQVTHNGPIAAGDPPRLKAKKLAKRALGLEPVLSGLERAVGALESRWRDDDTIWRGYRLLEAVYLSRGVREGYVAVAERGMAVPRSGAALSAASGRRA